MMDWGGIRKIFECQAKKPRHHQEGNREPLKVAEHL